MLIENGYLQSLFGGYMQNIKWLFFDLGSTLIDETECIKKRCDVICKSNNIDREKFISKVKECAKIDSYAVKAAANIYAHELLKKGLNFATVLAVRQVKECLKIRSYS